MGQAIFNWFFAKGGASARSEPPSTPKTDQLTGRFSVRETKTAPCAKIRPRIARPRRRVSEKRRYARRIVQRRSAGRRAGQLSAPLTGLTMQPTFLPDSDHLRALSRRIEQQTGLAAPRPNRAT
jgi:hypothetical protein